jgi:mono/diheme cytochrome c family protein
MWCLRACSHSETPKRKFAASLAALGVAVLLVALGGCLQSSTLGGQPPDVVSVGTPPTWQNGIQALMALKCAVCHVQPRPSSAPTTIPGDLNLTQVPLQGTMRGAQDTVLAIQAGILRNATFVAPKMPLPFSTPLVASEQAALEAWALLQSAPAIIGTTPTDGLQLYAYYCRGCHGVNGSGGLTTNVAAAAPAAIQAAIGGVPEMQSWPGLTALALDANGLLAIGNYLAQF